MSDSEKTDAATRRAVAAHLQWGKDWKEHLLSESLRDISSSGMFVECDEGGPELLSEVRFTLLDAQRTPIVSGLGRVVWTQPGVGIGVEFVNAKLGVSVDILQSKAGATNPDIVKMRAKRGTTTEKVVTIGIDLGTSNTCASIVEDGKPRVILDRYGTNTIPSVVTIDDSGKVLVGAAAAKRMLLKPEQTIYGSKRLIGRAFHDDVAAEFQPHFAYPIVEAEGGRFGANLGVVTLSMEEVARHILVEVRQMASRSLGAKVTRAVVTVPAYFTEVQRDAVRRAGSAAGFGEIRIISEPTAAALAYGYRQGENTRLAVFDLGGGTFDISILDIRDDEFEVIATGGDCFLGGIDFDDFIAAHLLDEFRRAERTNLEPDAQQLSRLRAAAGDVKHGLSVQRRFAISLPHFAQIDGRWCDLNASLDRERFQELAQPLIDRMARLTEELLESSKIEAHTVGDVLLNGGMTRVPAIQDRVAEIFGRRPSRRSNPDEAVALGAALMAEQVSGGKGQVRLIDVLPLSIGIAGDGRRFMRLFPRQTRLPNKRSFLIYTSQDNQQVYEVPVFQGEKLDSVMNEYLGTVVIEDIPPGPKGQAYDLSIALDHEGVLAIEAREERSRTRVPVRLRRGDVNRVIALLGPYTGPPVEREKRPVSPLGRFFRGLFSFFGRS